MAIQAVIASGKGPEEEVPFQTTPHDHTEAPIIHRDDVLNKYDYTAHLGKGKGGVSDEVADIIAEETGRGTTATAASTPTAKTYSPHDEYEVTPETYHEYQHWVIPDEFKKEAMIGVNINSFLAYMQDVIEEGWVDNIEDGIYLIEHRIHGLYDESIKASKPSELQMLLGFLAKLHEAKGIVEQIDSLEAYRDEVIDSIHELVYDAFPTNYTYRGTPPSKGGKRKKSDYTPVGASGINSDEKAAVPPRGSCYNAHGGYGGRGNCGFTGSAYVPPSKKPVDQAIINGLQAQLNGIASIKERALDEFNNGNDTNTEKNEEPANNNGSGVSRECTN